MENTLDASDSKASVAQNTRNAGKSSHVAALRSLGLLHDLQVSKLVEDADSTTMHQLKEPVTAGVRCNAAANSS